MLKQLALLLGCAFLSGAQVGGPSTTDTYYYNVEWRLITAGKAKFQVQHGPQGNQVNLHLESVGLVSKLFKVEDDYSANLNDSWCTVSSQMASHEGSRARETKIAVDAANKRATYLERDLLKNAVVEQHELDIPPCVHEVVGGLFYFHTLNLEPGQSTTVAVTDGKKSVMAKVEAQQREEIKTPAGVFKTVRYEVYLFDGVLYKRSAHLNIWLTDDRRGLPVQVKVRLTIAVGTITLQLAK